MRIRDIFNSRIGFTHEFKIWENSKHEKYLEKRAFEDDGRSGNWLLQFGGVREERDGLASFWERVMERNTRDSDVNAFERIQEIQMNYGYICELDKQAEIISRALNKKNWREAKQLLMETAAAETRLGKIEDKTVYAGMGLCQFDKRPFYNVRRKSKKYRKVIKRKLGVDIDLVEWEHLRYNPYLSMIFCRLYYLLIPKPIPNTVDGRAKYWKRYYNSYLGKGTIDHYVLSAKDINEA